jgi:hypothetical protein
MSKPVAKDLDEKEALREVVDALRADNGRLLRLLIAGFVSDGRPEHKELTEVLAYHPNCARQDRRRASSRGHDISALDNAEFA